MPARITIYGRPDCHLCDDAEALVADSSSAAARKIEVVNIEPTISCTGMLELIPVIELGGELESPS